MILHSLDLLYRILHNIEMTYHNILIKYLSLEHSNCMLKKDYCVDLLFNLYIYKHLIIHVDIFVVIFIMKECAFYLTNRNAPWIMQ